MNNENSSVEINGYGGQRGEMTLSGFNQEDLDKARGAMTFGNWWMRVRKGEPEFVSGFEALPNPVEDVEMAPFWRRATREEVQNSNGALFNFDSVGEDYSPSIIIQSLCGYFYTPERYQSVAARLESFGFECLRSRRGNDGQFTEIWYLPGLWAAAGDLAEHVGHDRYSKKGFKKALEFIRLDRAISFGTLDVSVQRMCMPNPD